MMCRLIDLVVGFLGMMMDLQGGEVSILSSVVPKLLTHQKTKSVIVLRLTNTNRNPYHASNRSTV